jgi:PadR family transcriptional regulator, regulatory protein PadR
MLDFRAMREPSLATLKVLRALLDGDATDHYGLALIERTSVQAGTLYPILSRLEKDRWIEGDWEDIDEATAGRRRRRYYRLTGLGEREARQILTETAAILAPPPLRGSTGSRRPGWATP